MMKTKNVSRWLFLLVMCLSSSLFVMNAQNKDWANLKKYEKDNDRVSQLPQSERNVVFMGNSITEGWVNTHPEFFTLNKYIGRGISGQTSYQFLVRFREDVIRLSPQVVVINAATNDVAENTGPYNEDYTFGNIVSMVELAKANKIKVILTTTLPASSFGWNPAIKDAPQKIKALNARVKAYAKKNKIPYVDYYSAMVTGDGMNPNYSKDGVHPTLEGYYVMEGLIKPVISKLVK